MQALQFPRGNLYQVVCVDGNQALSLQARQVSEFKGSRVVGAPPNANDVYQLWMIEKVGQGEDEFEIVNCASNFVWDEEGKEIRVKYGKQSNDQLFKVERQGGNNTFWFKTSAKGKEAVALEGVLRYKSFDPNVTNQLFYIVPVNNCTSLNQTCILVNGHSGKAVDVPQGSHDAGQKLIIWERNRRFNQRWRWVKSGNGFLLLNVLTGHAIDIADQKTQAGSKVVQWNRSGQSNQLWRPVPSGPGAWRLESLHAPGLFLGVKDDDVDDGSKVVISDAQAPSTSWKIEGFVPK